MFSLKISTFRPATEVNGNELLIWPVTDALKLADINAPHDDADRCTTGSCSW